MKGLRNLLLLFGEIQMLEVVRFTIEFHIVKAYQRRVIRGSKIFAENHSSGGRPTEA